MPTSRTRGPAGRRARHPNTASAARAAISPAVHQPRRRRIASRSGLPLDLVALDLDDDHGGHRVADRTRDDELRPPVLDLDLHGLRIGEPVRPLDGLLHAAPPEGPARL